MRIAQLWTVPPPVGTKPEEVPMAWFASEGGH